MKENIASHSIVLNHITHAKHVPHPVMPTYNQCTALFCLLSISLLFILD